MNHPARFVDAHEYLDWLEAHAAMGRVTGDYQFVEEMESSMWVERFEAEEQAYFIALLAVARKGLGARQPPPGEEP